jgi:hypothetical protein
MINTWDQPCAAPPNFVKISGAHRITPAMAAGVESRLWEIGDIVKVVEPWEARWASKELPHVAAAGYAALGSMGTSS